MIKQLNNILLVLATSVVLSGCWETTPKPTVTVDSEIMTGCKSLASLVAKNPTTVAEITSENIVLIGEYYNCYNRQKKSIEVIKILTGEK